MILIVLGVIALLLLLVGVVVKFVLPRFSSSKEVTLTWWGLWEDKSTVAGIIDEYQAANPKVKISYVAQSQQDYRERLTNSLAKGEGPDIFRFHNSWVPMFKNELSVLPASVMSSGDYSKIFYPVATSDLTSGRGFVGIPLEFDSLALFVNEDLLSKGGKNIPTTWDELRDVACGLTIIVDGTIEQSGVALGTVANVDHWQEIVALMVLQNGGSLSSPGDKLAINALEYFAMYSTPRKACSQKDVDRVWDSTLPPSTTAFWSGKLAMYLAPSWRAFEIIDKNPSLKFKIVAVPQLPKDNSTQADVAYGTYWAEGVWARSKNQTEAWKFLKYLSEKETLQKLFTQESKTRAFGEPYPRQDMKDMLANNPYLSGLISQAPVAVSWYLADRTHDGPSGINTQIAKYFEDALNSILAGESSEDVSQTLASGVKQILSQYGIGTR